MRRVVVTGMGIVSCLGHTKAEVSSALRDQRSGIRADQPFADMGLRSQVSGSVDIDLKSLIDRKQLRFMGEAAAYAHWVGKDLPVLSAWEWAADPAMFSTIIPYSNIGFKVYHLSSPSTPS